MAESYCNCADLNNSNNDCYWKARGYDERPKDVGDAHAAYSNANNPNNDTFGCITEHPNRYVARNYSN
jgi:hypothetical protein